MSGEKCAECEALADALAFVLKSCEGMRAAWADYLASPDAIGRDWEALIQDADTAVEMAELALGQIYPDHSKPTEREPDDDEIEAARENIARLRKGR